MNEKMQGQNRGEGAASLVECGGEARAEDAASRAENAICGLGAASCQLPEEPVLCSSCGFFEQESVKCDSCGRWFCFGCTALSLQVVDTFHSPPFQLLSTHALFCTVCSNPIFVVVFQLIVYLPDAARRNLRVPGVFWH